MGAHPELAMVWRGGGRRWFTRHAAERAEAKMAIRRRCDCDQRPHGSGDPYYICRLHSDPERYQRMVRLMVVMFVRRPSPSAQESGR